MTFLDSAINSTTFGCFALMISPVIIPIIILVAAFVFVLALLLIISLGNAHKEKLRHETIQRALEKGQPLPADVFSQAALSPEFLKSLADRPRNDRRGGLVAIAVGIGLYVFFDAMQSEGVPDGVKWVGLIPGLIGVALLVNWALDRGEKKDPSKT